MRKKGTSKLPDFWLGFFVSAILVIATFVTITTNVNSFISEIWPVILGAILASLAIFTLFIFFRDIVFKRITGSSRTEFDEIQISSESLLDSYIQQDKEAQLRHSVTILQNLGNWYLWIRFYRWVIATCTALLVAIAGFIGSVLLSQQNQILQYERDISELNLMGEIRSSLRGAGTLEYTLRDVLSYQTYYGTDLSKIDYPECNVTATISYPDSLTRPDFGYLIPYLGDAIPENRFSIPKFRKTEVSNGQTKDIPRLITLMEYFLQDREDSIVVSAIKFLDVQKSKLPHDDPIRLSNLLFLGIELEGTYNNDIEVFDSFLHSFSCKNCSGLRVTNSYLLLSDHGFNTVNSSDLSNQSTSQNLVFIVPSNVSIKEFPFRDASDYFESLTSSYGDIIIINSKELYAELLDYFGEEWEHIKKTNWIVVTNSGEAVPQILEKQISTTKIVSQPKSGPKFYSDQNFYSFLEGSDGVCSEFYDICDSNPFIDCVLEE